MKFNFRYKGRKFNFDVEKCETILSKCRGLMFRSLASAPNLLFIFKKKTRQPIHSFFVCFDFVAVWFDGGKVIDVKLVKPWTPSITSKARFDKLLEIPLNKKNMASFPVGYRKV